MNQCPAHKSSEAPRVVLGGEVGHAAATCAARFRFAPFDSLAWLRADLTGERVSEFDEGWDHVLNRPFKNFSGDISGRFIEIMAMDSRGDPSVHPALRGMLDAVVRQQRDGGYFCASGEIDWNADIDHPKPGDSPLGSRMMPALWGNARLLCGLVEAVRAFPGMPALAHAATRLGDFYISMLPRFNDPARLDEYSAGGSFAAGHITCWFPAMEGLVKLSRLTRNKAYLDAAAQIAAFFRQVDRIPIDHSHGMLCSHVSLLLLFHETGDPDYLSRVETRWDELVEGGYINPAGGILEKCRVKFFRDEGCAIVDWFRLNLALAEATQNPRYWAMAERTLHNHLLQNQTCKGGFGHRRAYCDDQGAFGFGDSIEESTWCCTFHGELGFINLRHHLMRRETNTITCNFALDFTFQDATGTVTSLLQPGRREGEVVRQCIALTDQPPCFVRVRQPHWADAVTATDPTGNAIPVDTRDNWCATRAAVKEVTFVYHGDVYAEDRRCHRLMGKPVPGDAYVMGYGPKLRLTTQSPRIATDAPPQAEDLSPQRWPAFPHLERRINCCFIQGSKP